MLTVKERRTALEKLERIYFIRAENIRQLVAMQRTGFAGLARQLGVSAGRLQHIAGPKPIRTMSEKIARQYETKLNLPAGWLDTDH